MVVVGMVLLAVGSALAVYLGHTVGNGRGGVGWGATVMPAQEPSHGTLDPELVSRFDQANQSARADGIELVVTSGWRSASRQQEILDQKIAEVGEAEARRLVAPVDASAHVQGLAIDVGPAEAAAWLGRHGWQFGLCQVYANEPWHFEPTTDPGGTCPAVEPDASVLWR